MPPTPEQLAAMGLGMPQPPDPATVAASAPTSAIPSIITSSPPKYPSSIMGDKIPTGALIPTSHQQGKDEFQEYMPKIAPPPSAPSGTEEWQRQRQGELASRIEQMDYKSQHPWGDPISSHPGVLGHILHGLSVAGNIAGDVVDPSAMGLIPGTQLHNSIVHGNLEKEIAQSEKAQNDTAETANRTTAAAAEKENADTNQDKLNATKVGSTAEEMTIHDLMAGNNGAPQINPATKKPYTYLEAFMTLQQAKQDAKPDKNEKPDTPEQQFIDEFTKKNPKATIAQAIAAYANSTQKPERPQRQLAVTPDGKVVELTPGMTIPQGTKTVSGDLAGNKPNAEELKRAEMAENVGENLDKLEEIVKRRPDLFGKAAGRITQARMWLGSDDPDVGALNTIKDQIGMAQQSAHSMRSAHHVEAAANSILNGFKNGPDALNSSIKTARESLKTFTNDVQEGNPSTRKDGAKKDNDPFGIR